MDRSLGDPAPRRLRVPRMLTEQDGNHSRVALTVSKGRESTWVCRLSDTILLVKSLYLLMMDFAASTELR